MFAAVKRGSDKTIICSKTVIAKPGSEAAVQDLCQQVRHPHGSHANRQRKTPHRRDVKCF